MFEQEKMQKELDAAKAEASALKAEREALIKNEEEYKKKLDGYRSKDFNFKRLRDMTSEEMEKLSETEKSLKHQQETLEDEQRQFRASMVRDYKEEAMSRYAGRDVEMRKRIEGFYDEFKGEAMDKVEVHSRVAKAAKLASVEVNVNPVFGAFGLTGEAPRNEERQSFAETDSGRGLASALGLGISKPKK